MPGTPDGDDSFLVDKLLGWKVSVCWRGSSVRSELVHSGVEGGCRGACGCERLFRFGSSFVLRPFRFVTRDQVRRMTCIFSLLCNPASGDKTSFRCQEEGYPRVLQWGNNLCQVTKAKVGRGVVFNGGTFQLMPAIRRPPIIQAGSGVRDILKVDPFRHVRHVGDVEEPERVRFGVKDTGLKVALDN